VEEYLVYKYMAIHPDLKSMLNESLPEMLIAAKQCIDYHKDENIWGSPGCLGYPSALLLLSVANSIGSYVIGAGNTEKHFNILNHKEYYNLNLSAEDIKDLYNKYRNLLSHNAVLSYGVGLDIGGNSSPVFYKVGNIKLLNLLPFYMLSISIVKKFLDNSSTILDNNHTIINISKK